MRLPDKKLYQNIQEYNFWLDKCIIFIRNYNSIPKELLTAPELISLIPYLLFESIITGLIIQYKADGGS